VEQIRGHKSLEIGFRGAPGVMPACRLAEADEIKMTGAMVASMSKTTHIARENFCRCLIITPPRLAAGDALWLTPFEGTGHFCAVS